MIKKIFLISTFTLFSFISSAQDLKKDVDTIKTKMDAFTSKTGSITKFIDIKKQI